MKLIISGIFIHLIFMSAIFDVYFQSPIITGMTPQVNPKPAPAKRLFLIVADGLRAESLFGKNLSDLHEMSSLTPFLSSKITKGEAAWGKSHTRVPTESRPGHVALAAGIYEDPSAIAKGWKENPVDFDSVFNESFHSWAWGSPDIVPMFQKSKNVETYSYSATEQDFSGKVVTYLLDTWVFDHAAELFTRKHSQQELKLLQSNKTIFFLHLLGLDTAGHTHKPGTKRFIKNLQVVDEGVKRIQKIVDAFYNDKDSAFIFTSDHGMTDWGSHGAGSLQETETPFISWGAGIKPSQKPINIAQADIAPLISTLIGIPIPVNSIGVLPTKVLNMTDEDLVYAVYTNAKQIYAQLEQKRRHVESHSIGLLYKPYLQLSSQDFTNVISIIEDSLKDRDYKYAILACKSLIQASINGLEYYQNYYQKFLLTTTVFVYLGWIALLLVYLTGTNENNNFSFVPRVSGFFSNFIRRPTYYVVLHVIFLLLHLITWSILYVQRLPFMYYVYCSVGLHIWWCVLDKIAEWLPRVGSIFRTKRTVFRNFGGAILYFIGIETLVLCFFHREALSMTLMVLAMWPFSLRKINYNLKFAWAASCLALAVFPFMPVVGSNFNLYLIAFNAFLWILANIFYFYLNCYRIFAHNTDLYQLQLTMAIVQSVLLVGAVINLYSVDVNIQNKHGLTWYNQYFSWTGSAFAMFIGICGPYLMSARLLNIAMGLLIPFILLSVSYEPLFLLVLFINLMLWLTIEHTEFSSFYRNLPYLTFVRFSNGRSITSNRNQINAEDFRRGFFILVYAVLAFFGMGNMASINSFDPLWVRNFVTTFSPFLMTALILFKTTIPYMIVSCVFRAVTSCIEAPIRKMFFIVLVFCDIMGLHFLFLVKNTGSWLEIGSSISHYVIVQIMVLFLLLLYLLAIPMTNVFIFNYVEDDHTLARKVHKF